MKKIEHTLFVLIILFSCFSGSLTFAAANVENSETLNNIPFSGTAIETAPLNPEFMEYMQSNSIELFSSDGEDQVSVPGYTPSPVDLSGLSMPEERLLLRASGNDLPAVYDLRKEGRVTPVKNQGRVGSCWAFSSIASLESYVLGAEGESWDFSENNMKNLVTQKYPEGFDLTPNNGGNAFMSTAYFTRWTGPVNESDDPYNDSSDYSPLGLPVQKHVTEVFLLPERTGPLDNEVIKRALLGYGAVYSTMYWNSAYYQDKEKAYRCGTDEYSANHAITLVGWNDSFSRKNFVPEPPGDGAFIVKNSWGEGWGEEGYFYVSYYDQKLGYDENAVFVAEANDNYDYIYQYDPLGWITSMKYGNSLTAWGGNIFSSERNEILRAVGFYTTDLGTAYEIYIYKDPINGPVNSEKGFIVRESGTYPFPGYHTHVLDSEVALYPGERFSVVIRFSNPSASNPLAVEQPISLYSSKAQANPGESYVSPDGTRWEDISDNAEANLCIKTFTTKEPPEADFSASVTEGVPPLEVQFTDISRYAFAWEWDLDGDGKVDSTAQNPVYDYTLYGSYNVSLNVSNPNGFDSETKNFYITVRPLSILSTSPKGDVTAFEGDAGNFSISTNYNCTISWYINSVYRKSETGVATSSYYDTTLSPGSYNVSAYATAGSETVQTSWNLTVLDWNPWDNSTSQEGENISTAELQEATHCYLNDARFPQSGAQATDARLKKLITLWGGK